MAMLRIPGLPTALPAEILDTNTDIWDLRRADACGFSTGKSAWVVRRDLRRNTKETREK